jgi:hypothetical protein
MKALNLFMLLLLLVGNSFAQVKHPFPNKDGEWMVNEQGPSGMYYNNIFFVEKDTVISNKEYSIISHKYSRFSRCALRSEGVKVYARNIMNEWEMMYNPNDTNEYVLYDYGLKVGDKIQVPFYHIGNWERTTPESVTLTVNEIDSIKIGKEYRKRLTLNNYRGPHCWIDGIGSSIAPIYQLFMDVFEITYRLDCYLENGERVFGEGCEPDYRSNTFPNKTSEWYIKSKRESDKDWVLHPYPDKVEKDTTINNQPYSILKSDAFGYRCAIRNADPKYYYIDLKHPERGENLLYDFGLKRDQTVKLMHYRGNGQCDTVKWVVDFIYITDTRKNYKTIALVNDYKDGLYPVMYWTEGYGSNFGPMYPLLPSLAGSLYHVYCYKEDWFPLYGDCELTSSKMPIDLSFRCSYISKQNRLLVEGQFDEFDLLIVAPSGRAVFKQLNCCDNLIDLSALKKGLYVCKFSIGNNSFSQKIRVE